MPRPEALMRTTNLDGEAMSPKEAHLVGSAYKVMGEKGMGGLSLHDVAYEAGARGRVPDSSALYVAAGRSTGVVRALGLL